MTGAGGTRVCLGWGPVEPAWRRSTCRCVMSACGAMGTAARYWCTRVFSSEKVLFSTWDSLEYAARTCSTTTVREMSEGLPFTTRRSARRHQNAVRP